MIKLWLGPEHFGWGQRDVVASWQLLQSERLSNTCGNLNYDPSSKMYLHSSHINRGLAPGIFGCDCLAYVMEVRGFGHNGPFWP